MSVKQFIEFVENVIDVSLKQIERKKDSFEIRFDSSAGFDYDSPDIDVSVSEVTDFTFNSSEGKIVLI